MKIYTKKGDLGQTFLMNGVRVSKSDDRIELLGAIDELSSYVGLAKAAAKKSLQEELSRVQRELILLMAGIAEPRNREYRVRQEQVLALEAAIDRMETEFPREKEFVLYGGCEASARLDVARAAARKAERRLRKVAVNYGADKKALEYMNRLSDYLYMAARYADYQALRDSSSEK